MVNGYPVGSVMVARTKAGRAKLSVNRGKLQGVFVPAGH